MITGVLFIMKKKVWVSFPYTFNEYFQTEDFDVSFSDCESDCSFCLDGSNPNDETWGLYVEIGQRSKIRYVSQKWYDRQTEENDLNVFFTFKELWQKYADWIHITEERCDNCDLCTQADIDLEMAGY